MTISQHLTEWAGKRVVDWRPGEPLAEPESSAYTLRLAWEEADEGTVTMGDRLAAMLDTPGSDRITALVIGNWGDWETPSVTVVEILVAARARLPRLTGLFLGDVTYEENEISWINQSDMAPLFSAFPDLTHLGVRGGNGLTLGANQHSHLHTLVIQTGGLGRAVLHELWKGEYPALEHLELWLGAENYGWDGTVEDLRPLLTGQLFPLLRYLGLRDSEIADEIAQALVVSPLLERIETLDLSLGTLSDVGAAALVGSDAVRRLQMLDLHHHYCSDGMMQQLEALGIKVDTGDQQELEREFDEPGHRYVAVSE